MLLTLIRLTMIVPLLASVVCVEGNLEKLSFVPSEKVSKVVDKSRRRNDDFAKDDEKHDRDEDSKFVEKEQLNKDHRYADDRDARIRRGSVNTVENRFPRSGSGGLAHKMAKDALKSPKVQETINKLSRVSSPKGSLRATAKGSRIGKHGANVIGGKGRRNGSGHRERRKKKRKRHHRRSRKHHPRISTRRGGSSKRTLDNKRDTSVSPVHLDGRGSFTTKAHVESSTSGSRDKASVVQVDDNDYVDFSTVLNTESPEILIRSPKIESENMIERLMKTTTKDPAKKKPVDQGVEYSDYYSDDEVLQDIVANKIPVQLVGSKSSNDRFARQALNSSSYRDRNQIRRFHRYHRGYDPRRKDVRHRDYSVNSLNDFQNYPTIERLPSLDDDPSQSYPSNYGPLENRNENSDTSYPVRADGAPEQTQTIEGGYKLQNNFDTVDTNKLYSGIQQPPVYVQNPDRSNYLNQYEDSQGETVNMNEAVQPKIPHLQSSDAYQTDTPSLGQGDNFDTNVGNQLAVDGDARVSNAKEDTELRTQSSPAAIQMHNNEISNNVPAHSQVNLPAVNLPNAMEQPFGKVLESLGINVNEGSNNINQKSNLNEIINHPVSPYNTIDHPMAHIISPSYLKKKPQEDTSSYYEVNNARGSDYQTAELRSGGNAKESYSRRQSIQDKAYDSNIMPHLDNDKDPAHNVNISIAVHDTKEVANQILDTIMEELEELKMDRSKNNKREGLPCRLAGSWSTAQAGMKLDMRVLNRSIIVTLSDLASPRFHESLLNGTWNVSGHAPFRRGSPFTLIATDNNTNSMAVFVGACRVCQGVDTIAGVWSVARQPKDCRDFQVSTSVFNDIFRKTKLSSLKETQGTNATEETTLKHDKRKS